MDMMTAAATCIKLSKRKEIWKLTAAETRELADAQKFLQGNIQAQVMTMKVNDPFNLLRK